MCYLDGYRWVYEQQKEIQEERKRLREQEKLHATKYKFRRLLLLLKTIL